MNGLTIFKIVVDTLLGTFLIIEIAHKIFGWTPPGLRK